MSIHNNRALLLYEFCKTIGRLVLGRGIRRSYGQFGEDAIVQSVLKSAKGFYMDVGAFHPILYSNTYALYRRGWSGVAVDPNPLAEKLFKIFRPRDKFLRCGVGQKGLRTYHMYNEAGYNTFSETEAAERSRIKRLRFLGSHSTLVKPLAELVAQSYLTKIDFLNIDAEGMDLEVLKTHDWSIRPTIIAVEGTMGDKTCAYLAQQDYQLVGLAGLTLIFKSTH